MKMGFKKLNLDQTDPPTPVKMGAKPEKKKSYTLIEDTRHLPRGKAPKIPPPEIPPVFCVNCIFYDFAKRLPEGNSPCNHEKFLGQTAALVRVDEKKCGMKGKYYKKVDDKFFKQRAEMLAAEHKARKETAKQARSDSKGGKWKRGKKKSKDENVETDLPKGKSAKSAPKPAKGKSSGGKKSFKSMSKMGR